MAKWGNALGGWKKQRRAKNGQFGNGSGSAKKLAKKTSSKKASSSAPKKLTAKKPVPKKKGVKAFNEEAKRREAFQKQSYQKAGGIYRQRRDILMSQGAYENNQFGNKVTSGTKGLRVARTAGIAAVAPNVYLAPTLGVSYARHRKHIKSANNSAAHTLSGNNKKKMSAATKKKIAVGVAVLGTAAVAYGTHRYIQDKKFDALPGITLYHNANHNVNKAGFKVSDRINAAYGDSYVFLSNTNGGRARAFGRKQYRVKYTGDPSKIMRDHAEDAALLNNVGGEKFFMIPQKDLQGMKVRRTTALRQSRKGRYHGENMTPENVKRSREEFGGVALKKLHAYQAVPQYQAEMQKQMLGKNPVLGAIKARRIGKHQNRALIAGRVTSQIEDARYRATKNSPEAQARRAARKTAAQSGIAAPTPQAPARPVKSHQERLRSAETFKRNQAASVAKRRAASTARRDKEKSVDYAVALFRLQNPGMNSAAINNYRNRARMNGFAG